jgi:hypothetical protein
VACYALKGRDAAGRARYSRGDVRLDVCIHGDGAAVRDLVLDLSKRFQDALRGRIPCHVAYGGPIPASGPPAAEMTRAEQRRAVGPLGSPLDDGHVTLLVTPRPLEGNRFSTWHAPMRAAVVSLSGSGTDSRTPVAAFLAYEVVLHGLRVA